MALCYLKYAKTNEWKSSMKLSTPCKINFREKEMYDLLLSFNKTVFTKLGFIAGYYFQRRRLPQCCVRLLFGGFSTNRLERFGGNLSRHFAQLGRMSYCCANILFYRLVKLVKMRGSNGKTSETRVNLQRNLRRLINGSCLANAWRELVDLIAYYLDCTEQLANNSAKYIFCGLSSRVILVTVFAAFLGS